MGNGTKYWTRWVLQSARNWEEMKFVIKETGIAHIDHEHKRMTDFMVEINKLLIKLENNFCLDILEEQRRILNSFYSYTKKHCDGEEEFIKKYNIPGLELQQREHKKLLSIMKEIIFNFNTGRVSSAFRHRVRLLEIVVNHINKVDNKVFNFKNISEKLLQIINWDDINTFIRLIHVPLLDRQHKDLTELIIDLSKLIEKSNSRSYNSEKLKEKLIVVRDFTEIHFNSELDLIQRYNIQDPSIQNEQHEIFINLIIDNIKQINNGETVNLKKLKENLLIWWIQHINIFDYRTFRKSNWIKPILMESKKPEDVSWLIAKVGIQEVDDDHRHFLDILFENLDIFDTNKKVSPEKREEGINNLFLYAKQHFDREEKIMETLGVLDREQHIIEHNSIIESLTSLAKLNSNKKIELSSIFKHRILSIWISHINDTDTGTFGVSYD